MTTRFDVSILGSGPAAMAAAAACSRVGLRVALVAPTPDTAWHQTLGGWRHELEGSGFDVPFDEVWSRPRVCTASGTRTLDATYALIDNDTLQERLWSEARVQVVRGEAHGVQDGVVRTDAGDVHAAVVIDATGHGGRFLRPAGPPASAFQVAWGLVAEVDGPPWGPGEMTFMDLTADHLAPDERAPSFLYALPRSDGTVLLEETSLAGRPPMSSGRLQDRLARRLQRLGIRVRRVRDHERVQIPMDPPMPVVPQPVVGFGAAAAFVNPATGYSVARALTAAPALARALSRGLSEGGSPEAASVAGWEAVWPAPARRAHGLRRFGLEVLLARDAREIQRFFDTFFSLPTRHWRAYLDPASSPGAVAASMAHLFALADGPTRRSLAWAGLVGRGLWRPSNPLAGGVT